MSQPSHMELLAIVLDINFCIMFALACFRLCIVTPPAVIVYSNSNKYINISIIVSATAIYQHMIIIDMHVLL